jgi:GxxExxY protein
MVLNVLTAKIIKAAISVHRELGPGLLESVYKVCLIIALRQEGLDVQSEISLPVIE